MICHSPFFSPSETPARGALVSFRTSPRIGDPSGPSTWFIGAVSVFPSRRGLPTIPITFTLPLPSARLFSPGAGGEVLPPVDLGKLEGVAVEIFEQGYPAPPRGILRALC